MSSFEVETTIEAPVDEVWHVLADIGTIDRWNPGVRSSHTTTEQPSGLGAARHCALGGKSYLKEEVVVWEPGGRLTMRITDTNLPFHAADIRFALWSDGDTTRVRVSPDYRLRYGWIGGVLDRLYVARSYRRGMEALLSGLKRFVESRREEAA